MIKVSYVLPGGLAVSEAPAPRIRGGEALVRHRASGVSVSDVASYRSGVVSKLFHKNAGEVAEVGSGVEGLSVGDRVYYNTFMNCGSCPECLRGLNNLCQRRGQVLPDDTAYAGYVVLPERLLETGGVYRAAASTGYGSLTHVGPLSNCIHSVEKTRVKPGDRVLVVGAGYMGLLHLALLRATGAGEVTVSDVSESRLAFASRMGADRVVNPLEGGNEEIRLHGGANAVIVSTSSPRAMRESLLTANPGGRVNLFGGLAMVDQEKGLLVDAERIHYRELELMGSYSSVVPGHYVEALRLIEEGRVKPEGLDTGHVALREAPSLFRELEDPASLRVVVTD